MAGIGFRLRSLARQETLTSVIAAAGHASVIAAGPWLFTILSLAIVTMTTDHLASRATLSAFRVIIIYAFAVSLVLTAPVTIIATRRVADALWLKRPEAVATLLIGALAVAIPIIAIGVGLLAYFMKLKWTFALALWIASALVGMIWIALAFCGAVRDYRGVTASFAIGLVVSVICSISAAVYGYGATLMAVGFAAGLAVTLFGLVGRVLATFPHPVRDPIAGVKEIVRGLGSHAALAIGALLGTIGVWVDKWVFWLSPIGERLDEGFLHAPLYDSTMFISSLVMIPALAAFVVRLETDFFDRYQQYYATISSHGTIGQIEHARSRLHVFSLDNLLLITLMQVGLCIILIMSAPVIIDALGLQFRQISMLRFGALGAVFNFVFIAASSIVLFFDRRRLYLLLQTMFLALMLTMTLASLWLGEDYYGAGYFIASLIAGLISYVAADRTFERLNYLTFIGNNPSIVPSTGAGGSRSWPRLRRSSTRH